ESSGLRGWTPVHHAERRQDRRRVHRHPRRLRGVALRGERGGRGEVKKRLSSRSHPLSLRVIPSAAKPESSLRDPARGPSQQLVVSTISETGSNTPVPSSRRLSRVCHRYQATAAPR